MLMEWTKEIPEITGTEWEAGRDRDRDEGIERKEGKKEGVQWERKYVHKRNTELGGMGHMYNEQTRLF